MNDRIFGSPVFCLPVSFDPLEVCQMKRFTDSKKRRREAEKTDREEEEEEEEVVVVDIIIIQCKCVCFVLFVTRY